jgi:hypothetical protein
MQWNQQGGSYKRDFKPSKRPNTGLFYIYRLYPCLEKKMRNKANLQVYIIPR